MQHLFLLLGGALAALYCAWPYAGEARIPLSSAIGLVRILSLTFITAALVVWDVKRRHATAEIEKVHGIRVAEMPTHATAVLGSLGFIVMLLTFAFDQQIAFEALVARNEAGRREGALVFLERHPHADLIDGAFDYLLEGEDYLDVAAKVYPSLVPDLRARAASRVLDRISAEAPGRAGCNLAAFITLFEGDEAASAARRRYVEHVVPRFLALPPKEVPDGARALLRALAESAGGPRLGLLVDPAKDVPRPIESLVGRLQRIFASRAPYQVVRGTGAEFVPRRIDVRWESTSGLLTARVQVVAAIGGGRSQQIHETRYVLDLNDKDPHAPDRFAEAPIRDVLPPP